MIMQILLRLCSDRESDTVNRALTKTYQDRLLVHAILGVRALPHFSCWAGGFPGSHGPANRRHPDTGGL